MSGRGRGARRAGLPGPGQAVIVLGAGQGRRMGGPKLFAEHGGRTFVERILARCGESGARATVVVDPRQRERLEGLLGGAAGGLPEPLWRVVEADGEADMLSSVQAALAAVPWEAGFWLWPVDAPFISAAGWRRAVEAVAGEPGAVWKLRAGGRTGHPIWFPGRAGRALLEGQWADGLRGYLATLPAGAIRVLHLEGEFLEDVDTPQDLAALARRERRD